jgi:hypothetical protein
MTDLYRAGHISCLRHLESATFALHTIGGPRQVRRITQHTDG